MRPCSSCTLIVPLVLDGACSCTLAAAVSSDRPVRALQYQITHQFNAQHSAAPKLTNFQMDLGVFLASRGNYSWSPPAPPFLLLSTSLQAKCCSTAS